MTLTLNSIAGFTSVVKLQQPSKLFARDNHEPTLKQPCGQKTLSFKPKKSLMDFRWKRTMAASDSNTIGTNSTDTDLENTQNTLADDQPSSPQSMVANSSEMSVIDGSIEGSSSNVQQPSPKRSPLTAREKLRAARFLSRYADKKPSKPEMGSKVLDALRESDKGKRRSGLPEAPSNLFDDSKRGLPKQGLTFNFPGGADLLLIVFSFVFISSVMFATTYIVWKAGAIHFNEY